MASMAWVSSWMISNCYGYLLCKVKALIWHQWDQGHNGNEKLWRNEGVLKITLGVQWRHIASCVVDTRWPNAQLFHDEFSVLVFLQSSAHIQFQVKREHHTYLFLNFCHDKSLLEVPFTNTCHYQHSQPAIPTKKTYLHTLLTPNL